MWLFRPIQSWKARRKIQRLPNIVLEKTKNHFRQTTAPNPSVYVTHFNTSKSKVGTATYAISPLFDKLFLYEIKIEHSSQRRGYGFAFLYHLHRLYGLPIIPIHEWHTASGFWNAARRLSCIGLFVTPSMSISDLDEERKQWAHFEPEAKRLDDTICLRLRTEEWDIAVGRGLDDWQHGWMPRNALQIDSVLENVD